MVVALCLYETTLTKIIYDPCPVGVAESLTWLVAGPLAEDPNGDTAGLEGSGCTSHQPFTNQQREAGNVMEPDKHPYSW